MSRLFHVLYEMMLGRSLGYLLVYTSIHFRNGALINAQSSRTMEIFREVTTIEDSVGLLFSTQPDGSLWSSFSTTWHTVYFRTVRIFTTTGEQGQTQILAEVTRYSKGDASVQSATTSCSSSCIVPGPSVPLSAQFSAQASATADPTDASTEPSAVVSTTMLSIPAIAGVSLGATSAFLAVIIGLFLMWRQHRRNKKTASSRGSVVDSRSSAVSAKVD